jgi:hypothetical protein
MEIQLDQQVVTIVKPCTVIELRQALNELDAQYDNYFVQTEEDKRSLLLAPLIAIIDERVKLGQINTIEAQNAYDYIYNLSNDALNRLVKVLHNINRI